VLPTITSNSDTRHMDVQRRPVAETVKVKAKVTAKANSKESATIAVDGKATELTTAGRKKRTKKRGQSGIRERQQAKSVQLLLMGARA
jgi:hypothetical protein